MTDRAINSRVNNKDSNPAKITKGSCVWWTKNVVMTDAINKRPDITARSGIFLRGSMDIPVMLSSA